jgi:predicted nucleic acid-binding protein
MSCVTVEQVVKNITLAIEDEVLDKVRVVAAQKRTTVNAMVRDFLAEIAGRDEKLARARRNLLRLTEESEGRMVVQQRYQLSYWDSQIVAAAEPLGANVLYSEDLNHGQSYGAVCCENLFRNQ